MIIGGELVQDSPQKRAVLIEHLLSAMALANELGDGNAIHLIERAIAEVELHLIKTTEPKSQDQPKSD